MESQDFAKYAKEDSLNIGLRTVKSTISTEIAQDLERVKTSYQELSQIVESQDFAKYAKEDSLKKLNFNDLKRKTINSKRKNFIIENV